MNGAPEIVAAGICVVTISSTGTVVVNMPVCTHIGGMSETAADTTVLVCEQATKPRSGTTSSKDNNIYPCRPFRVPCLISSNEARQLHIAIHEQRT